MRAALDRRLRALEVRSPAAAPADPATVAAVRDFLRTLDKLARDPQHSDHRAALDVQRWEAAGAADLSTLSDAGLDVLHRYFVFPSA